MNSLDNSNILSCIFPAICDCLNCTLDEILEKNMISEGCPNDKDNDSNKDNDNTDNEKDNN